MFDGNVIFSIVTPCLNQGKFVGETIESVVRQKGEFFIDYIIMDGGSEDNTAEVIGKYIKAAEQNEFELKCKGVSIRYFSRKDNGQADAINNGFRIAKGNVYGFINSDDIYEPGAFEKVVKKFSSNTNVAIVYGNAFYIDENSEITGLYRSKDINRHNIFDTCFICQPTLFMKREVYEIVGPFNTNVHNSFDYDYWLRICSRNRFEFVFLRDVLASSRMHRENKTTRNRKEIYCEYFGLMRKYDRDVARSWKIRFAKETSYFAKIVLKFGKIAEKPFIVIAEIYSFIYFWYYKKRRRNFRESG